LVCRMGDTSGPLGAASDRADPHAGSRAKALVHIPILALDSAQVHRFLRSVAVAKEQDRQLQLRWQDYKDSRAINAIYAVLFWKGRPGWMEADIGDPKQLEKAADADTAELLKQFVTRASTGPAELKRFLEAQARVRAGCLASIRDKFAEVSSTNAEVRRDTAEGVRALAKIKLGSDLFLQAAGLASGVATVMGLGYDVITGLVGSWDKAVDAKIIAVSKPIGMEAGKKAAEKLGDSAERKILEGEGFAQRTERLGELIGKYEKHLIGKQGRKAGRLSTRIRFRAGEMETAEKLARRSAQSAAVRKALGKLNYLFIADSVYDSWYEYRERLEAVSKDLPDIGE
jgi:hypothetical protein